MSTPAKLKALHGRVRIGDVNQVDYNDLQRWIRKTAPSYDVSCLSDLDRERIDSMFAQFYEVRG